MKPQEFLKKAGPVLVLVAMAAAAPRLAPKAHAMEVTSLMIAIPLATGEAVLVAVLAPTATTEGAYSDRKELYYQELRDDAAQEVAGDGEPSAVLESAIQQIRDQTHTSLDDRAIALQILKGSERVTK